MTIVSTLAIVIITFGAVSANGPVNEIGNVAPELSIADVFVTEDDGNVVLTITQSVVADQDVIVEFATLDGTAVQPEDYTDTRGKSLILQGATSTRIDVLIIDDGEDEATETFKVVLSNAIGGILNANSDSATVTILDTDPGANLGYIFAVSLFTWAGFFGYVLYSSRCRRQMHQELKMLRKLLFEDKESAPRD